MQGGEGACGKKQGVARQKRGDHETRFAKDNGKKDKIDPGVILLDNGFEGFVEVQEAVD